MNSIIKLEELAQFILAAILIYYQPLSFRWWMWGIIFLLPDLGMIGYTVNTSVGAVAYNLFHHKLVAILLVGVGWYMPSDILILAGLILYAHSSFDRVLGYGLKYMDSFRHTHIGWL
jgi:hypothetical protein